MSGSATAALLADLIAGEPPAALHPTVWMGHWLAGGRARRRSRCAPSSLLEGLLVVGGGCIVTAAAATVLDRMIDGLPTAHGAVRGLALKPALSIGALIDAATEVQRCLELGQLNDARRALGRHLVSRETSELSAAEVAGAAIESVAENLSDSFVAPLIAFRLGGLRWAYVYRMLNTADAMFGYRTSDLAWYGKSAARMDDIANFVPARLTAVLICCTAVVGGGISSDASRVSLCDARRTSSPNAGWPMAAMAGALGVQLTKRGHYTLNVSGRAPTARDIRRCCRIALAAATLAATLMDLS